MEEKKQNAENNVESQNNQTNNIINMVSGQNIPQENSQPPSENKVIGDNSPNNNFTGITPDMITVFPQKSEFHKIFQYVLFE